MCFNQACLPAVTQYTQASQQYSLVVNYLLCFEYKRLSVRQIQKAHLQSTDTWLAMALKSYCIIIVISITNWNHWKAWCNMLNMQVKPIQFSILNHISKTILTFSCVLYLIADLSSREGAQALTVSSGLCQSKWTI